MSNQKEEQKKIITDDLEIIDIFRYFSKTKERLWAWQQIKLDNGSRPVHFITVRKLDIIKKYIEFNTSSKSGFQFVKDEDIFVYSKSKNIAVKTSLRELEKEFAIIPLPTKLNILSDELAEKLAIVEKEDEEGNLTKREAPRKQANEGQLVTIEKISSNGTKHHEDLYGLYDISQGGMGFRSYDPSEFFKDDKVKVIAINEKPLPKPLIGTVMSVRQLEDEGETFKIGVKFGS